MSPARRGLIIFALAFLFLAGALSFDYWWVGADEGGKLAVGGPFTLVDVNGVERHPSDFRGKLMLVYFGYAFCPDACPTTLMAIGKTLDLMGPAAADQVQPLFITVDPARDTVKQMKLYMANFSPRILGLTGTPTETAQAAKVYHVFYEKVPQPGGGKNDYLMDHTSLIYLMNRKGQYLTDFVPGVTPQQMATEIKRFL